MEKEMTKLYVCKIVCNILLVITILGFVLLGISRFNSDLSGDVEVCHM